MKLIRNEMQETTFTDVDYYDFSSFIFKLNQVCIE